MTQAELQAYLIDEIRSGGVGGLTLASEARAFLSELIDSIFAAINNQTTVFNTGLAGKVPIVGDQVIQDLKTFVVLPQSTPIPTLDEQLTNKLYVDEKFASVDTNVAFDSTAPIKRQTPGLESVTLGQSTFATTLQELLYPEKFPSGSIGGNLFHFYGDDSTASINFTIIRTDAPIVSADINGVSIGVTGDSQVGSVNVPNNPLADTTFVLTINTATKTIIFSFTSTVVKPVYVGQTTKDGVIIPILDTDVQALTEYSDTTEKNLTVSDSNYLIVAVPTGWVNLFAVNESLCNWFTKVRSNTYVNEFGYSSTYDIYVSNTFMSGFVLLEFILNPL